MIHHTGIIGKNDIHALTVHHMHLNNGCVGICCHFFIRKDGYIETVRPLTQTGAHAYGHNETTIGICLAGNFDVKTPTIKQTNATAEVIAMLCRQYDLKQKSETIVVHRDLDSTDCPGTIFYPHLYALRE